MAKSRETRAQRLLKSPDEVGVEDATLHLRGGLTRIIPLRREHSLVGLHAKPADRFSQRGAEGIKIGMTREQFGSLQGVFEGLKSKVLGSEDRIESGQGVFVGLMREAQGGQKTRRVWEIDFNHAGTFKINIPGVTALEGIAAAELIVKYIVREGDRKETTKGRYEAKAVLNYISGELKKRLPASAEKAKTIDVQYVSSRETISLT